MLGNKLVCVFLHWLQQYLSALNPIFINKALFWYRSFWTRIVLWSLFWGCVSWPSVVHHSLYTLDSSLQYTNRSVYFTHCMVVNTPKSHSPLLPLCKIFLLSRINEIFPYFTPYSLYCYDHRAAIKDRFTMWPLLQRHFHQHNETIASPCMGDYFFGRHN